MNNQLDKLLDAHVAFELSQWRGKALERNLKAEAVAFWAWAQEIRLDELSHPGRVQATARRLVLEMELPDALADMIADVAKHLVGLPLNRETTVADVLDENVYDEGVELLIELQSLREALIKASMESPVFAAMASEVLYQGIKDYVFSDSGVLKAIPGVSSLISRGTSAVNKRMPKLEAEVEKRVRSFLETNMTRTLKRSETFLLETLTAERIRAIAAELWDAIADVRLSAGDTLADDDIDRLAEYGLTVWRQLRETEYLEQMIDAGIARFFELYGRRPVAELLESVGVTEKLIRQEAVAQLPPLVEVALEADYLEAFLRRRLEPFYHSRQAAKALV